MPIYEYTCKSCNTKFEKLVRSMNSTEKVDCPSCGSKKTERAMSVFAVATEGAARNAPEMPPMCQGCGGDGPCPMRDE